MLEDFRILCLIVLLPLLLVQFLFFWNLYIFLRMPVVLRMLQFLDRAGILCLKDTCTTILLGYCLVALNELIRDKLSLEVFRGHLVRKFYLHNRIRIFRLFLALV